MHVCPKWNDCGLAQWECDLLHGKGLWALVIVESVYDWQHGEWRTVAYMCHSSKPESYDVTSYSHGDVVVREYQ